MCQQLPSRQDQDIKTSGVLVALCWKSATVEETVARLRKMGEDFTLGSRGRVEKQMFTQTEQSLATVHRRYTIYILILIQDCQKPSQTYFCSNMYQSCQYWSPRLLFLFILCSGDFGWLSHHSHVDNQ